MNSALLCAAETNSVWLLQTELSFESKLKAPIYISIIICWTSFCVCKVLLLSRRDPSAENSISASFSFTLMEPLSPDISFKCIPKTLPPASYANWFLQSFFFPFFLCIGSLGECSHWRRQLRLALAAAVRRKWARLLLASFERQVHEGHRQQFTSHLLGCIGPGIISPQEFREKVLENKCEGVTFRARLIPPYYLFRVKL